MYKIKASVCSNYDCSKDKEYNNDKVAQGWAVNEVEWNEDSIRKLTTELGISPNEYSSDKRKSDAWIATNFLMLDIDGGVTKDDLISQQPNWEYDSYVFSSQNHQRAKERKGEVLEPEDRLRVMIPLAKPIATEAQRRAVEKAMIERFPQVDRSFMGRARYYAHGTEVVSSFQNSKGPFNWEADERIQGILAEMPETKEKTESRFSARPFNMEMMFDRCAVLKGIEQNEDSNHLVGTSGHRRRLFLASQCLPFGEEGRRKVHEILQNEDDYDPAVTDRQLDSVNSPPQTCEQICGNKRCANICKSGGRSPIKFGYMESLVPFLEKQTSAYAYYDWRKEALYFVDSEKKLKIIFADCGQDLDTGYTVLEAEFNPASDLTIDRERKTINLFHPTDYLVLPRTSQVFDLKADAPSILRLLTNLIPVKAERVRFLNWMAGIMQTRQKQLTAWIFMGTPGAGKNVMINHLFKPLFGRKQATTVEHAQLEDSFNPWLQNALIIAFNEVAYSNSTRNKINSKIKAIITEDEMRINEKHVKSFEIENHANTMFFSNHEVPVLIEKDDRRFNVVKTGGNLRDQAWFADPAKFFADVASEIPRFAQYLMNYNYDADLAMTVIENSQKGAIVSAGMTRFEEFATHLKENDVEWFRDNYESEFGQDPTSNLVLDEWIEKDKALKLFRNIYGMESMSKKTLTQKLALFEIRPGEAKDILGSKVKAYRWG